MTIAKCQINYFTLSVQDSNAAQLGIQLQFKS